MVNAKVYTAYGRNKLWNLLTKNSMNIKELKEHIENLPDDMLVVTRWYENWFDDAYHKWVIKVLERKNKDWWDWKYDYKDEDEDEWNTIEVLAL